MRQLKNSVLTLGLILNLLTVNSIAQNTCEYVSLPTIDIYRTAQMKVSDIYQVFGGELQSIAKLISDPNRLGLSKHRGILDQLMCKIINAIKKKGDFVYVNISPVFYPKEGQVYISLDIVDEKDKERLSQFLPLPQRHIADPDHLVANWQTYENIGFQIIAQTKQFPFYQQCPAYHCMFGFDDKNLRKYKDIFSTSVPKNKLTLIEILQYDKSVEKRAAAAYLIAHLKDGEEIINILTPSMFDSSPLVRNNVMRVLNETLSHITTRNFPIEKLLQVIDFPATTDRNKALLILAQLAKQASYADYIANHATQQLLACLSLKQPNIHLPAYEILRKISGKNYADVDYPKWKRWVETHQRIANA